MDVATIATILGTGIGVAGFIYTYLRNFKADMDARFDKMSERFVEMDKRVMETNKRMDGVYNVLLKRTE